MKALQYLQVLALIALIIYLVAFHLGNPATAAFPVGVRVLRAPVSLALLGGFAGGLAFAGLLALPGALRALIRGRSKPPVPPVPLTSSLTGPVKQAQEL